MDYPHRHPVTANEFLRMGAAGVFEPEARLELIEGEIIEIAPIGPPHASVVDTLTAQFHRLAGNRAIVRSQGPFILNDRSVPQPDLVLLQPHHDRYFSEHPGAADVILVVEVSDSTLRFDLGTKVPLYARAGIEEAWVVDISARSIHAFRDPRPAGYRTSLRVTGTEALHPLALPDVALTVATLFPP